MQILSEKRGKGEHFQTHKVRITVTQKPDKVTTKMVWHRPNIIHQPKPKNLDKIQTN